MYSYFTGHVVTLILFLYIYIARRAVGSTKSKNTKTNVYTVICIIVNLFLFELY